MRDMITLTHVCPFCRDRHSVSVHKKDYFKWQAGEMAQRAFPYLSSTEREQLISNICPACQESIFGGEDDE